MKKCSVDLVAGFLSSGKSSFINLYLKNIGNKEEIVVIQCEQGKKNIDDKKITLKTLQSNEELTEDRFLRIIKFYFPTKIIIECNGIGDILAIVEFLNN
ncbi:MAG: GTP-binding protein, partial [Sarcina sp.]